MNFNETITFLYNQLPVFQRQGKSAYKDNLDNTLALDKYFNHPHKSFKTIHIAGTNGKGSTSHMLASVLQEAGYKVGLYTSPHLLDMRERIKVNGYMVDKRFVVDFVADNHAIISKLKPSFFELMVMMSFEYFKMQKVDVAIMEVGMGGRLDSTNIINPEVTAITNIGMDHIQFLGDTLEKIAAEKAGIIKAGVPVIIGEKQPEIAHVFTEKAKELKSELTFADAQKANLQTDLKGNYQHKNLQTAYAVINSLKGNGFTISQEHIATGLKKVIKNTGLLGRWQILNKEPLTICDTAHNKEGLRYVLQQIAETDFEKLHIVLGMVSDKAADEILQLFPKDARYYLCQAKIPRAMKLSKLCQTATLAGFSFEAYNSVQQAVTYASEEADDDDLIFIGGSTFVVAEALELYTS